MRFYKKWGVKKRNKRRKRERRKRKGEGAEERGGRRGEAHLFVALLASQIQRNTGTLCYLQAEFFKEVCAVFWFCSSFPALLLGAQLKSAY